MYDAGADIVYAAAGGSGTGVFEAALAAGKKAIGVDSDQYLSAAENLKPVILTSALKRVDTAVFDFIDEYVDGKPKSRRGAVRPGQRRGRLRHLRRR